MRASTVLGYDERNALHKLGKSIRLARLRRGLSQNDFAERVGVGRGAVVTLENGAPGVGIGILAKALMVLGYADRLGDLLASDPIGDEMDLAMGRQRAGAKDDVADF